MSVNRTKNLSWLLVAGVVVACGILAFLAFGRADDSGKTPSASSPSSQPEGAPTSELQPETTVADDGGLAALEPSVPEGSRYRFESPDNVAWYPVLDGVPAEFTATRSIGFPRNEEGAALAAWHILNRAAGFNLDGYETTINDQVTGENQQAMKDVVAEALASTDDPEADALSGAPVGYDVEFFNPINAQINVYAISTKEPPETRNENKVAIPIEMMWEDGDWKMVAPDQGFLFDSSITPLDPEFSFGAVWQ